MKIKLFLFLLSASLTLNAAGYKIDITINRLNDKTIYLGHYYGDSYLIKDTIKLDASGEGIFSGDNMLPQGLYMVLLPGGNYFDIIIGKEQVFSITTDTVAYVKHMKISGSKENQCFLAYQQYMMEQEKEKQCLREELIAAGDNAVKSRTVKTGLTALEDEIQAYRQSLKDTCPDGFFVDYLSASAATRLPEEMDDKNGVDRQNIQKLYQYKKHHYFDHIDLTDSRFLRTPLLHRKIDQYFNRMLYQETDTLIKAIDQIAILTAPNEEIYKYVLTYLFKNYHLRQGSMYRDVYIYLVEQYYLAGKTPWITTAMKNKLQEQVERLQNAR